MPTASGSPPKARRRTDPPKEHSEWAHTPVSAAVNAAIVLVFVASAVRRFMPAQTDPIWALAGGGILAAVMLFAGRMRTVQAGDEVERRPLGTRSLVYRFMAMFVAGSWLWIQLADFGHVDLALLRAASIHLAGGLILTTCVVLSLRSRRTFFVAALLAAPTVYSDVVGATKLWAAVGTDMFLTTRPLTEANIMPWLWHAVLQAALLATVFALLGSSCASFEQSQDDRMRNRMLARAGTKEMVWLQEQLRDLMHAPNLLVIGVDKWDNGAGETYRVDGSEDGISAQHISSEHVKQALAAKLRLPQGCGVEASIGEHRGESMVKISRVNKIKDKHPYPSIFTPRTVYNAIPVGVYRDGTEVGCKLRSSSMLVWAQKDGGKTTLLYDVIAGLAQCTDVLIWAIDLGGAGVALPFLWPFIDGRTDVPTIDWVAGAKDGGKPDLDEALAISQVALAIARDRKTFYKRRKRKQSLMPMDSELPMICLIVDEGAEVMGSGKITKEDGLKLKEIKENIEEIIRIGRDCGVNVILSTLRATSDALDPGVLSNMAIRCGLRVSDTKELAYGFGDWSLDPADAPYQGSGFIVPEHGASPAVMKAYVPDPELADEVAVVTAPWRPFLDDRAWQIGGKAYAERWYRATDILADENGNITARIEATTAPPSQRTLVAVGSTTVQSRAATPTHGVPPMPAPMPPPTRPAAGGPPPPPPPGSRQGPWDAPPGSPFAAPPDPVTPRGGGDPSPPPGDQPAPPADSPFAAATGSSDNDLPPLPAGVDKFDSPGKTMRHADELLRNIGGQDGVSETFDKMMEKSFADPSAWPEPPAAATAGAVDPQVGTTPTGGPLTGRQVLEAYLRSKGPAGAMPKDAHADLAQGGPWGPVVGVTYQTILNWLNGATYIADRKDRQPYVHRDCLTE